MAQQNPFDQFDAPAQGNPFNSIPLTGADPARQYAAPQAEANLDRLRQQIAQESVTAPYEARTAAAQATKAEVDAETARRNLQAQQATANPQQQAAMAALGNDEILAAITKARENLNRFGSAGFAARLPELIQPQSAIDLSGSLNTIASRLTLDKLSQLKQASPTGASGLGSLTEREGALLRDSVAGLGQTQSPEQLRENLAAVERHYRNFMALAAGEDYRDPKVAERYGIALNPENPGSQGQRQLATGDTAEEADPALGGVNNRIRSMIGANRSPEEIVAFMNAVQPGLGDARAADVKAAATFRAQNPEVPLSRYSISVENRAVPLSGARQAINTAAQTPGGAYFAAAGDAVTGGLLDNATDNPALARAGMELLRQENPVSSLAGTVTGGALAGAGFEAGLAGAAGRFAPLAADALYGGIYGAGSSDEGSRLAGAVSGGLLGAGGGIAGRRAVAGLGGALRGVQDESAQYLRNAGVTLTPGQIAGGRLRAREDRLSGFAGVGDAINARRREGLVGYNQAAFREGLNDIGGPQTANIAEEGVEDALRTVGQKYASTLDPVMLTRDRDFGVAMQAPTSAAGRLPGEMGENARYSLNERVGRSFDPNGQMSGRVFQQAVRGLEQDARAVRTQAFGSDFGGVARGARGALEDLLERQSPGTLPDYLSANAAYRNTSILGDAVAGAMNNGGIFTPAQLGNAARQNARQFTGRLSAATTDRPFFELQRAGQDILPNRVPDSGTAGRIEAGQGLMSLPRRVARTVVNAPLYAEATQPFINRALLDRSAQAVAAGTAIGQRSRLGGMFFRPIGLTYGMSDY